MSWNDADARQALRRLFEAAVGAADPRKVLAAHLPAKPQGRCIVVGMGKSAAAMVAALEDAWPDVDVTGTVVTRYGYAVRTRAIEVIEAPPTRCRTPRASGARAGCWSGCRAMSR